MTIKQTHNAFDHEAETVTVSILVEDVLGEGLTAYCRVFSQADFFRMDSPADYVAVRGVKMPEKEARRVFKSLGQLRMGTSTGNSRKEGN